MAPLLVLLLASAGFSGGMAQPFLKQVAVEDSDRTAKACSVDELVPPHDEDISGWWDTGSLVSPPFDCTCTTLKAKYVLYASWTEDR